MSTQLRTVLLCLALLLQCFFTLSAAAQDRTDLTVAAAADLSDALRELASSFERSTGTHVRIVVGSSGNLFAQIENGAPFDVFMSADMDYPRKLVAEGKANGASLYQYAVGELVLAKSKGLSLDLRDIKKALMSGGVKRIAIANPQHAPYGRAAIEALHKLGMYDSVASKLVVGENVSQAAQFLESGNAQVAFIALARVFSPAARGRFDYVKLPSGTYKPIQQGAVLLKRSETKQAATAFFKYLRSPEAKAALRKYGFEGDPTSDQTGVRQ